MSALYRDETRGHFAFELPPHGQIERRLIGADLGPTLHLTMSGAHLTPDEARTLAEALVWWADRKHDGGADLDRLGEVDDLLSLLDEAAS